MTKHNSDMIFLLGADGGLERIRYSPYSSESVLQELIAHHPELLAGEQINPDDPPKWLLVMREAGIPDEIGVPDRWSADHLLLDHRGVPTFVEVKRSADTRIRREIVGQMLDYAANATLYWPMDRIRSLAAEQAGGIDDLNRAIHDLVGYPEDDQESIEAFWTSVDDHLRTGPLRLLFVADEIPRELRRVIEFLNEHMPKIEVFGVEVRQYEKGALRALVPRLIGQSERARQERSHGRSTRRTSEAEFLAQCPEWSHTLFNDIFNNARDSHLSVSWGTRGFSVRTPSPSGEALSLLYGYPAGAAGNDTPSLEVYLKYVEGTLVTDGLRSNLVNAGFREGVQFTLRLVLTEEAVQKAHAGLPHIWHAYRDLQDIAV